MVVAEVMNIALNVRSSITLMAPLQFAHWNSARKGLVKQDPVI